MKVVKMFRYTLNIVLTIFVCAFNASAQSIQQQKTDSVFALVKKNFNNKSADGIYNLAGAAFKKALTPEAFKNVADQQLFPLGPINQSSLISFVNNKVATYKLQFDAVTLQLLMSLDNEQKLEMFLFQPYKVNRPDKSSPVATSNPLVSLMDRQVDSIARPYIQKANTVGMSIGILRNGKISIYNYGETKQGNGKVPDANTLFEIGSITKTFTATLLAWYVNEGKIKLTDPITKFLPDSVASNKELSAITLVDLSNHTSGLPRLPGNLEAKNTDALDPYKNYTKQQLYTFLKTCKLNSKPGEQYVYSNLAVGLLGSILEKVGGKPYEQLVEDIICKPLGMNSTAQHLNPALAAKFITVYNDNGAQTPAWNFDVLAPCGALRSTVNDLLVYAKANMTSAPDQLSKAFQLTHKITFTTDVKLGLAWHIITLNNVEYYFHNGGTYGCSSFLAYNPEKKLAVVVLSNSGESVDATAGNIVKKFNQ